MRITSTIVGSLVAVAFSTAAKIALPHLLKTSAVPPVQFVMPPGSPVPRFDPTALPFQVSVPSGFPTPEVILGRGPAAVPGSPRTASRTARSPSRSPGKSVRAAARPAPAPAPAPAPTGPEVIRWLEPPTGR